MNKINDILPSSSAIEQAELGQVRKLPYKLDDFERGEIIYWIADLLQKVVEAFGQKNFIDRSTIESTSTKIVNRFSWLKIADFALFCSDWVGGDFGTTPPNLPTIFAKLVTWSSDKRPEERPDGLTTEEQISETIFREECEQGRRLSPHETEKFTKKGGSFDLDSISRGVLSNWSNQARPRKDLRYIGFVYSRVYRSYDVNDIFFLMYHSPGVIADNIKRIYLKRWFNDPSAPQRWVEYDRQKQEEFRLFLEQEERVKESRKDLDQQIGEALYRSK